MKFNEIHCGDCIDIMKDTILDESIDLVVTSPPYDNLRKYNGYSFDFEGVINELHRVVKKDGVIVWIVNDAVKNGSESGNSFRQALGFIDRGFKLYDTMIYRKMNGMPLNHRRYEQKFEYMFIFTKSKPRVFNPILEKCAGAGNVNTGGLRSERDEDMNNSGGWGYGKPIKDTKIKENVWSYYTGKGHTSTDQNVFKHPATFPERLAEDHILSWSNEGDIVLDPFMGSGTTPKMAKLNGRQYIGIDISEEYCTIANDRVRGLSYQTKLVE